MLVKPVNVCESGSLSFFRVHVLERSHVVTKGVDGQGQSGNVDWDNGVNVGQGSSHFTNLFKDHVVRRNERK
jgi:hypothetical protein